MDELYLLKILLVLQVNFSCCIQLVDNYGLHPIGANENILQSSILLVTSNSTGYRPSQDPNLIPSWQLNIVGILDFFSFVN